MVIDMLLVETMAAENIDVVAPAEDPSIWDIGRKQVPEPKDVIIGCPCTLSMAVESVEGDNTRGFPF